jgi:small subunit ribosomal protein S4
LLEKQFAGYYEKAARARGVTGSEMLVNLERRLDNIVYRLGFGNSRSESRQLVNHGHVLVNGKNVNIASYPVRVGDSVEIKEKNKKNIVVQAAMSSAEARVIPDWLTLDKSSVKGTVKAMPTRDQLSQTINEQLIVELYSR